MSIKIQKLADGYDVNGKHVAAYGGYVPRENMEQLNDIELIALNQFIVSMGKVKIQSTIKTPLP